MKRILASTAAFILPVVALAQVTTTTVGPAPSAALLDLSALMQPVLAVVGAVMASLLAIYVPKALAAFEKRTGIQLTDQQRAQALGAVQTAAGIIETKLDQGALQVARVSIADPTIRAEAQSAIDAVPVAAAALNLNVDSVSRMIVGKIDTAAHGTAPAPLAAPVQAPAPVVALGPLAGPSNIGLNPAGQGR